MLVRWWCQQPLQPKRLEFRYRRRCQSSLCVHGGVHGDCMVSDRLRYDHEWRVRARWLLRCWSSDVDYIDQWRFLSTNLEMLQFCVVVRISCFPHFSHVTIYMYVKLIMYPVFNTGISHCTLTKSKIVHVILKYVFLKLSTVEIYLECKSLKLYTS